MEKNGKGRGNVLKNNFKKIVLFAFVLIGFSTISQGKYIFEYELDSVNLNIDRTKPKIICTEIKNTNTGYEQYANKTHIITIKLEVEEKNIGTDTITSDELSVKIADKVVKPDSIKITQIGKEGQKVFYQVELKGLKENGTLKVELKEGTITDTAGWMSEKLIIDTKIMVDNIPPVGTFSQKATTEGRIRAYVTINEAIRTQIGWNMTDGNKGINKEFSNNIYYELPIVDYAQNQSMVKINITEATRVQIIYGSHNSEIGWTYGYKNTDIAGKEAVQANPIYKTEALAIHVEGGLPADYIRARAYIYTHWGEGSKAECGTTGLIYTYGYNPSSTTWKSIASVDFVTMNGKRYFQFGGSKMNQELQTDINGNNPIPVADSRNYLYGISGLNLSLKDTSYYSIVYQILVNGVGWLEPKADGVETVYRKTKPMSAFRMVLIPKTEKQYIIDMWNKDVGTMNMN